MSHRLDKARVRRFCNRHAVTALTPKAREVDHRVRPKPSHENRCCRATLYVECYKMFFQLEDSLIRVFLTTYSSNISPLYQACFERSNIKKFRSKQIKEGLAKPILSCLDYLGYIWRQTRNFYTPPYPPCP